MIEVVILSFFIGFVQDCNSSGKMPYPSGINDVDEVPVSDYAVSKAPVLPLSFVVYDSDGVEVPVGNYQINISKDEKYIDFVQAGNIIASFVVLNKIKLTTPVAIQEVKIEKLKNKRFVLTLKTHDIQFFSEVESKY